MNVLNAGMMLACALGATLVQAGEWSIDVANASNFEEPLEVLINGKAVGNPLPAGTSSGLLGVEKGSVDLVVKAGDKDEWSWDLDVSDGRPLVVVLGEKAPAADAAEPKRELVMEKFEFRKDGKGSAIMVFNRLTKEKNFTVAVAGERVAPETGVVTKLDAEPGMMASLRLDERMLDSIDVEGEGSIFFYLREDADGKLRMFQWYVEGDVVRLKN